MEKDLQSRYAHLLQPIRDLTRNWDVDVASQLEEYLTEIEQITISFDGGSTKMNFAEAALLIQGSTCVYSKKVEYLYAMVYQTLDLIASRRKLAQVSSVDNEGRDDDVSFAQRREEDKLLGLDDLAVGTNIDLNETAASRGHSFKTVSTIPRTPMSLIPLQESEKIAGTPLLSHTGELLGNKMDFKMNTGLVHSTGALLLEPMNQMVIEVKLQHKAPIPLTFNTPAEKLRSLLMPNSASNQVAREPMDEQGQFSFAGDAGGGGYSDDEAGGFEPPPNLPTPHRESTVKTTDKRPTRRVRLKTESKADDPWKLLDPHEPVKTEKKPHRKGTTYRLPPSLTKKTTSRKRKKSVTATPSVPLAQFLLRSFYSCSSMFPKNPMKAPLSSEFEGLYWEEQKARKMQKKKDNITLSRMRKQSAVVLEQQAKDEEAEDNVEDYQPLGQADNYDDEYDGGAGFDGAFEGFHDNHTQLQAGQPAEGPGGIPMSHSFAGVEPMALDEPSGSSQPVVQNYEDLVRNYVESTLSGALTYVQETALSKRVQEWEDRIKPTLITEERHPVFDIHHYGASVLKEIETVKNSGERELLYFFELARNKEQYEICRMFAAVLQLANDHNVEISWEGVGEGSVDTMGLTLLNTRMAHEAVLDYRAPSLHT